MNIQYTRKQVFIGVVAHAKCTHEANFMGATFECPNSPWPTLARLALVGVKDVGWLSGNIQYVGEGHPGDFLVHEFMTEDLADEMRDTLSMELTDRWTVPEES